MAPGVVVVVVVVTSLGFPKDLAEEDFGFFGECDLAAAAAT